MTEDYEPTRTDASELDREDVLSRLRSVVKDLCEDGVAPAHITSAFAYVATEFGLFVAPEPAAVFQVVLTAVAAAAGEHRSAGSESPSQEVVPTSPTSESVGKTLH